MESRGVESALPRDYHLNDIGVCYARMYYIRIYRRRIYRGKKIYNLPRDTHTRMQNVHPTVRTDEISVLRAVLHTAR